MDKHYYDSGLTDYSGMHPWSFEFWYHMFINWDLLNWTWVVLGLLYIVVKLNDTLIYNSRDDV